MKRFFILLSLIAFFTLSTPAFAHSNSSHHKKNHHTIHAGHHHRHKIHHGPRAGLIIHSGYPRHISRYNHRHCFLGNPYHGYGYSYYGPFMPMGGATFILDF